MDSNISLEESMVNQFRVGNGVDIHPLTKGRKLILAGIHVEHDYGCQGHSDGDVLTHSIMDSILGALGKGDIGDHFPSSNKHFKNANSMELLQNIFYDYIENRWNIVSIDSTIILQEPIIKPYINKMIDKVFDVISDETSGEHISIKATTTDHLGFIGEKKGVAALSTCLLIRKNG